jgi:sugar (pentulose or hexulose) kinase
MSEVAIAIDTGTSGARAVAVDLQGRVVAQSRRPYPISTPRPGWAEQDADDWAERSLEALAAVAERIRGTCRVVAIGLTGQCPTVAPFGRNGRPVGPGMMYRDNRAIAEARQMRDRVGVERMHQLTGHVAEAFHVGPKILWLRANAPEVFRSTALCLQPRDVVLKELTGERMTDESHANATLFFELRNRRWCDELLAEFNLDRSLFPTAAAPWTVAGPLAPRVARKVGLRNVPVVIGAPDSQCAALGADVTVPGPVSEMAGASTCINTTVVQPLEDVDVTHYSHAVPAVFCTEVGVNTAGAAIEWGRRRLGFADHAGLEAAARRFRQRWRSSRGGHSEEAPLFLPYLGDGERIDPSMRGGFVGLSSRHDSASLGYAVIEGVAIAVCQAIGVLKRAGSRVEELRCSGGGARHELLAQIKADHLGVPVLRLHDDATAIGCAVLALAAVGHTSEAKEAVAEVLRRATHVEPDPWGVEVAHLRGEWFERVLASPAIRTS